MQSQPSSPTAAPGEPQRDPELWFEDGNVVIVAGSAAFRVHTGVLSRHSEIFQNMVGVPQPPLPASSDVIEGHPVVHVSDSAHDFKQLLHALYDGAKFMPPDQPVAFGIIGAITRLGHKYHVEWILDEAKRRLRSIFTTSFEVWSRHKGSSSDLVDISSYPPWIEAVNLIRLIGEIDMLPMAIYQCCQSPSLLFKGTARVDGTVETLDLPTLELCYNAHINLIQRQSELRAKVILADPSEECKDKERCGTRIRAAYRDVVCPQPLFLEGDLMNSQSLVTIFRAYEKAGVICGICAVAFRERDRDARRAVWRDLPTIMGIAVDNWGQGSGRDPDFWFEDGNIVVIADSTSFRIHRSVLARHSDLLADRLGSADQARREGTSDGCPVVRITDSARSFKALLSLLYPGPPEILRQASSSRATHQYLRSLLPSTFDEWVRQQERTTPRPPHHPAASESAIAVLNAVREIQADDLLPLALYLCAQLPPYALLRGSRRPSGALDTLRSGDAERCLVLRADMVRRSTRMALRLFAADAPDLGCGRRRCRTAVAETFGAIVGGGEFEDAPRTDPLGAYWRRYVDGVEDGRRGEKRVCARCAGVLREREVEQRRELWDELPRLAGF